MATSGNTQRTNRHIEYRLSWEGIGAFNAADMETLHGPKVWPTLSDADWEALPWQQPTVKIDTDPWQQFNTLRRWAETHEQPIRKVRLEQREVPDIDSGWIDARGPYTPRGGFPDE